MNEEGFYEVKGELTCNCVFSPNNYFLYYDHKKNVIAMCINCYKTIRIITEELTEVSKNGIRIKN